MHTVCSSLPYIHARDILKAVRDASRERPWTHSGCSPFRCLGSHVATRLVQMHVTL